MSDGRALHSCNFIQRSPTRCSYLPKISCRCTDLIRRPILRKQDLRPRPCHRRRQHHICKSSIDTGSNAVDENHTTARQAREGASTDLGIIWGRLVKVWERWPNDIHINSNGGIWPGFSSNSFFLSHSCLVTHADDILIYTLTLSTSTAAWYALLARPC